MPTYNIRTTKYSKKLKSNATKYIVQNKTTLIRIQNEIYQNS